MAFYDCEPEFIVCCGVVALLGYRKRVTLADAVTFGSWISLTTSVSWLSLHRTRRARPKEPSPITFCTEYLSMWLLYSPHGGHHEQKRLISTRSGSSAPVRIFCFTAYSDDEDLTVDNGYDWGSGETLVLSLQLPCCSMTSKRHTRATHSGR